MEELELDGIDVLEFEQTELRWNEVQEQEEINEDPYPGQRN